MGDVDAARILYFAAPYRWLEELFTGWCKSVGQPIGGLLRAGTGCPCVASAAQYSAPLAVDDEIALALYPSAIGETSFAIAAVKASSWHAWSRIGGGTMRPLPLPAWLRQGLAAAPLTDPVMPKSPTVRCPDEDGEPLARHERRR